MNPVSPASNDAVRRFGGFRLGDLRLALPMESLREVVPCLAMTALPCPCPAVVGGIDVRGVLVPVLDLRLALGRPAQAAAEPCVIVMVHGGHVLGLLADGVTCIFTAPPGESGALTSLSGDGLLFSRCLADDQGTLSSVLSPEALLRVPGLALAHDCEPARQGLAEAEAMAAEGAAQTTQRATALQMMLVRCGRIGLAIDAMAVHSTLSDPVVRASPLAQGVCRGVIDWGGGSLPAIDLLALCAMGSQDLSGERQAFVLEVPEGRVALLVGAVVDIVSAPLDAVIELPAYAMQRPDLVVGVLPAGAATGEGADPALLPYLVLDPAGLHACEEVVSLASVGADGTAADAAVSAGSATEAAANRLLTFDLGCETATPLDQIQEILPFRPEATVFDNQGATLGVVINRGRSIPMLCLSRLTAARAWQPTAEASVLVVESDGDLIGFVVPGLRSIEETHWQPEARHLGALSGSPQLDEGDGNGCRQLALVGAGSTERLLPILDLQRLARSVQAGAQPRRIALTA